ncbi:TetR/AcrR family transcriptional regulator [Paludibacterium paludis]|uniref:TetR family transcriptional regulator n=1 Tax=Paludibacterium paludis TaxID=1225769 RepID=A0A918P5Y1_9NEIS|nr:TetR/AcrR family transcriptional regulator [Paludibacterium paludis]GGY23765.1 TetR family transcriptional regulator [Paludibacterium paludis]
MTETIKPPSSGAAPRRAPRQERSRQRVQDILDAAALVIAEVGLEAATLSEVARRANITLASLYRYFPNKAAVVRQLAEHQLAKLREPMARFAQSADIPGDIDTIIDVFADFYRKEPAYREVWSGIGAMPELAALDQEDLLSNVDLMSSTLRERFPHLDEADARAITTMLTRAIGAVLRLAMVMDDRVAEVMLAEVKFMARSYLRARLAPPNPV